MSRLKDNNNVGDVLKQQGVHSCLTLSSYLIDTGCFFDFFIYISWFFSIKSCVYYIQYILWYIWTITSVLSKCVLMYQISSTCGQIYWGEQFTGLRDTDRHIISNCKIVNMIFTLKRYIWTDKHSECILKLNCGWLRYSC